MAAYPPSGVPPYPPNQNVGGYSSANSCVSKIELHISCNNLTKKDITSSSDPIAVLHMQDKGSKQWIEVCLGFLCPSAFYFDLELELV